ncbi:unnamed protein product [Rotaria magnacalcarata]|uniref:G-protein coupled receptors family 1 profile domain-containing protein n=3 Tax=Rotaria magnacalcarata TaxID=392030 RepID=A0A816H976_9BILA|nr:unnamed protein product [Rotaria magnacalcarata]CAF3803278.1 unnamed protein product [Rotaria magnacalcarata]
MLLTTLGTTTMPKIALSTISLSTNETLYQLIKRLLNGTDLYKHQIADLIEPEKYSITSVHIVIWTFTILTYLLAIPLVVRMFRSGTYSNAIDYFSTQIILCAFIAWIPALILLLHNWFGIFTARLCRFHYVILSTNEAVPLFFVLYMIIERFLYAHPSLKYHFTRFSSMLFLHFYTIFTWIFISILYTLASPFYSDSSKLIYSTHTAKYCLYNYSQLYILATARSIIYFILLIPALVLIGLVIRYFFIMRGTNQVSPIEKLWTIRVTALLCILIFYDVYLYYLEHIVETFKSFLLASLLRASFYLTQIFIIACTESYWLEMLLERCACICCFIRGQRRTNTTSITMPTETEFHTIPYSSSIGHYSLVDDSVDDEFDRAFNGPQPTLRVIT